MLSVKNLTKIYKLKGKDTKNVVALDDVSIDFPETGMVFLLGKSGSGKSTLLNTIGGLDTFDKGEIVIKGKSSKEFKQSDFDAYRNTFIGFIFQEYNILEEFSVGKNLALALELQGKKADKEDVDKLLDQVDLSGYYKRNPNQLSGGQRQRVAIARALIKEPEIIMADEPTGALDSNTGKQVMDTLKKLSKSKLVIIVSHDREFAEIYGDRVIELKDGKIVRDVTKSVALAEKSKSGVSYIDDKIIHIKKGQVLMPEDFVNINKLIRQNSQNQDTIISFDTKSNDEIKKVAFITDDGNREVFSDTKKDDLKLKQYDPKQFKLIRSRLKVKDAVKMGTSSLKHKPIRLAFTIFLSFIAFGLFGLVDTMASFNVATSTYDTLRQLDAKTLSFTKGYKHADSGYTENTPMKDEDYVTLSTTYSNYNFFKVVGSGKSYYIQNAESSSSSRKSNLYDANISGFLPIDDDTLGKLNLTLIEGRCPTSDDEICISANIFESIKQNYKNISSLADLSDKKFYASIDNFDNKDIVGIVQDDTDISKYKSQTGQNNEDIMNYLNYTEIRTVTSYGLVNMCYVTQNVYNSILSDYKVEKGYSSYAGEYKNSTTSMATHNTKSFSNIVEDFNQSHRYEYKKYNEQDGYWETSYFYDESEVPDGYRKVTYEDDYIMYKKAGYDISSLENNQVILSKGFIDNYYNTDDIQSALDNGIELKITSGGNTNVIKTLQVVALSSDYGFNVVVSQSVIDELFGGYDYLLTRLNAGQDRDLIRHIVDTNKDGNVYTVQFSATPMLSSFASLILSLSQAFLYLGIILAVFAGFMLMNFIATSITYKKREIGVLRAIGAGKKDVFSIFFSESLVIAIINFVLSLVGCIVAAYFINRSLYVDLGFTITLLSFGIRQVILLLGISVGVALISTFLPVYNIAKKNPIDSINNR